MTDYTNDILARVKEILERTKPTAADLAEHEARRRENRIAVIMARPSPATDPRAEVVFQRRDDALTVLSRATIRKAELDARAGADGRLSDADRLEWWGCRCVKLAAETLDYGSIA